MKILTISGTNRPNSSSTKLLMSLGSIVLHDFKHFEIANKLPLFYSNLDNKPLPPAVVELRAAVDRADAIIICTTEYIHNIPAQLKNILEWMTSSGNLVGKKVLPITFTPNAPRGEKAMQSLIWSLKALDAQVMPSLALYKTDVKFAEDRYVFDEYTKELIKESFGLLGI